MKLAGSVTLRWNSITRVKRQRRYIKSRLLCPDVSSRGQTSGCIWKAPPIPPFDVNYRHSAPNKHQMADRGMVTSPNINHRRPQNHHKNAVGEGGGGGGGEKWVEWVHSTDNSAHPDMLSFVYFAAAYPSRLNAQTGAPDSVSQQTRIPRN